MPKQKDETEIQTETQTPTEDMESLKTELAKLRSQVEEKDKGFKSLQTELNKRGAISDEIQSLKDMVHALAANREATYSEPNDFTKNYEKIRQESERETKRKEAERVGNEYKSRVEKLGLTEGDDDYWDIYDKVSRGLLKAADAKLSKLEKQRETPKETSTDKPKTFDQLSEEEKDELARSYLESKGLLKTDTGGPSSGQRNFEDIEKGYIAGNISEAEYRKARQSKGIY